MDRACVGKRQGEGLGGGRNGPGQPEIEAGEGLVPRRLLVCEQRKRKTASGVPCGQWLRCGKANPETSRPPLTVWRWRPARRLRWRWTRSGGRCPRRAQG